MVMMASTLTLNRQYVSKQSLCIAMPMSPAKRRNEAAEIKRNTPANRRMKLSSEAMRRKQHDEVTKPRQ